MTYKIYNRLNMDGMSDIMQTAAKLTERLNQMAGEEKYSFKPCWNGGKLRITSKDEVIDFGEIRRYPHCYDYIPADLDIRIWKLCVEDYKPSKKS